MNDLYVDDCLSGASSQSEAEELADQLTVGMMKGGYVFKYFIFSGRDPPAESTTDGVLVVVAGYRWLDRHKHPQAQPQQEETWSKTGCDGIG